MKPKKSDIGYMIYGNVNFPITSMSIENGAVLFKSVIETGFFESITVDMNADLKITDVNGNLLLHKPRVKVDLNLYTAEHGGKFTINQDVKFDGPCWAEAQGVALHKSSNEMEDIY
jgi:hypothetical protein